MTDQQAAEAEAARAEARSALSPYGYSDEAIDELLFKDGKLRDDYKDAIQNVINIQEAFKTVRGMQGTEKWSDEYIYALVTDGDGKFKKDYLAYVTNIINNIAEQERIANALAEVKRLKDAKDWDDEYIYSLILNEDGTLKDNYMDIVNAAIRQGKINDTVGTIRYWLEQYQNGNTSAAGDIAYYYKQLTEEQKKAYFSAAERALIESIISQGGSSGVDQTGASGWTQQEEVQGEQQVSAGEQTAPVSGTKFRASDVLRSGETYAYKYNFDFEKYDSDLYKADGFFSSEKVNFDATVSSLTEEINTEKI